MSNFSARVIADLDTSKIPSQLKDITKKHPLVLNNFTLNTKGLPSQIQAVLDSHKFTIHLGNIKGENIESQLGRLGGKASEAFASKINAKLNNGGIESAIASVTAKFEKFGATGHSKLSIIQSDIQELNRLQAQMNGAANIEELVSAYTQYDQILTRVKNNLVTVAAESSKMATSLQVDQLNNRMETWLHNNSAATKQYGASVESLRTRLNELYSSGELTEAQLREIAQEFNNVATSAKLAGATGKTFGSTLVASFKSILKYVSVSTLIYQLINAFRSMYNNVLEINTAMVELKKVTKETDVAYDAFLDNAGKKAQKLGTTIKELVTSTADFARLGYSLEDSETLAEVANIYSVVGDDIENIDVATQSIVSTMTAFKVDVKDAMRIVDKFNEVSNNFAISSGGIGEALQRSASSLAAANNTLDQSIALITAANTVVQDPDSVGTAFKTIAMRIRAAKTELEEAGLEADGMANSTAELRKEIMDLSGVDIMLDENTFKSTYEILDELSEKWDELEDTDRANITELLAGKRQGNVFNSVMSNFDIARDVLATSEDSNGSAMAEHEKWLESLEAKTKQFQAAWEELSQTILDDDFLGQMIDLGTDFLNVLTWIIDNFGMLGTVIGGLGLTMLIKNFD